MPETMTKGANEIMRDLEQRLQEIEEIAGALHQATAAVPMGATQRVPITTHRERLNALIATAREEVAQVRPAVNAAVNAGVDATMDALDVYGLHGDEETNLGNMLVNQVCAAMDDGECDFVAAAEDSFDDPSEYADLFPVLGA